MSDGDYVEQLTFLLFLKMADELAEPPFKKASTVPKGHDLLAKTSMNSGFHLYEARHG